MSRLCKYVVAAVLTHLSAYAEPQRRVDDDNLFVQAAAQSQPPRILQIFREQLRPSVRSQYDRIETDTAQKCRRLGCPHAYLAAEALTGTSEVWWFNGYASVSDKDRVVQEWANNHEALSVLAANREGKARLALPGTNLLATYREDLSAGTQWHIGAVPFLVISLKKVGAPENGSVFETGDGVQLTIVPVGTLTRARAVAGALSEARIFVVRPSWSNPSADWIRANPKLWQSNGRDSQHR